MIGAVPEGMHDGFPHGAVHGGKHSEALEKLGITPIKGVGGAGVGDGLSDLAGERRHSHHIEGSSPSLSLDAVCRVIEAQVSDQPTN